MLVSFSILTAGCGPKKTLIRNDLLYLKKGYTEDAVFKVVGIKPNCTVEVNSSKKLNLGIYNLSATNYYGSYFLLYAKGRLIYWGYPHEYARHQDGDINEAMKVISSMPGCGKKPG
jgi:hypothetical protein